MLLFRRLPIQDGKEELLFPLLMFVFQFKIDIKYFKALQQVGNLTFA